MLVHAAQIRLAGPSWTQARTYAISVATPKVYPGKKLPRVYSVRKNYLYNQYTKLFQSSTTTPLIFLTHNDFSVKRFVQLRYELATAATRHTTIANPLPGAAAPALPTLTVIRTSIFGVALREYAPFDSTTINGIAKIVKGGLVILSLPSLDPPLLNAVLRALARNVPPRKPKTEEQLAQEKKDAEASFVPGRRPKRQRPTLMPELSVVGALIEGRVFMAEGVQDVAKLPTLDTIRAQLVGLLSAPASQLAMVLGEASGGKLARTLEGFKKSLEDGPSQDGPPTEP